MLTLRLPTTSVLSRRPLKVFDLRQHKNHTRSWEAAFRRAVRMRTRGVKHRIFIGLSSGYDSGAIMLALHLERASFMAYHVPSNEQAEVVSQRIARCKGTAESVVLHLSPTEYARERSWLDGRCEPYPISALGKAWFPCSDKAAVGLSVILSQVRAQGGLIYLSGSGADETISDYASASPPAPTIHIRIRCLGQCQFLVLRYQKALTGPILECSIVTHQTLQ